ncbi:MAG: transcription elongation factor GreA [Candidatus Harrisonbacteria bacterium]|nr:transcription elongation factor GreA [Candidatus Harrisonbacteria bacterium]
MSISEQQYFTKDRLEELKKELEALKHDGRIEISERLKRAKDLGDLSENAEYQEARESQNILEKRIFELEEMMKHAVIIKKSSDHTQVRIGSTIMTKHGSKELKFTIVGANEARPESGFISNESPIGKAFLGKKAGDEVKFKAPKGEMSYKVVSVD